MLLENKVAIITGGARGIGKEIALRFAEEGCSLVIADVVATEGRRTAEELSKKGREAVFIQCDVSDSSQVKEMVDQVIRKFGKVDILVNNAGIMVYGTILDTNEDDWDRLMATNLKGVYLCSKFAVPRMIERGEGVIINIASAGGLVGIPAFAAYNASKGGVILLTKNMAIDLGRYNIRVNCLCPGITLTPMAREIFTARAAGDLGKLEKIAESGLVWYPLGRYGNPEEIAQAALFLASENSSFMTGASLVVDGGYTAR